MARITVVFYISVSTHEFEPTGQHPRSRHRDRAARKQAEHAKIIETTLISTNHVPFEHMLGLPLLSIKITCRQNLSRRSSELGLTDRRSNFRSWRYGGTSSSPTLTSIRTIKITKARFPCPEDAATRAIGQQSSILRFLNANSVLRHSRIASRDRQSISQKVSFRIRR